MKLGGWEVLVYDDESLFLSSCLFLLYFPGWTLGLWSWHISSIYTLAYID